MLAVNNLVTSVANLVQLLDTLIDDYRKSLALISADPEADPTKIAYIAGAVTALARYRHAWDTLPLTRAEGGEKDDQTRLPEGGAEAALGGEEQHTRTAGGQGPEGQL